MPTTWRSKVRTQNTLMAASTSPHLITILPESASGQNGSLSGGYPRRVPSSSLVSTLSPFQYLVADCVDLLKVRIYLDVSIFADFQDSMLMPS